MPEVLSRAEWLMMIAAPPYYVNWHYKDIKRIELIYGITNAIVLIIPSYARCTWGTREKANFPNKSLRQNFYSLHEAWWSFAHHARILIHLSGIMLFDSFICMPVKGNAGNISFSFEPIPHPSVGTKGQTHYSVLIECVQTQPLLVWDEQ